MKVCYLGTALALYASTINAADYPPAATAMIDERVNPCDNFYKYACGGWLQKFPLPADRSGYGYSFSGIADTNRDVLVKIFKQDKPIIGPLYNSCMNVDQLDALGTQPITTFRNRIASVRDKQELFVLAGELALKGLNFLGSIRVGPDPKDATRNRFMAGQSPTTLGDPSYYTDQDTWTKYEQAFRTYVTKIFTLIGYDAAKATEFTNHVVDLEQQVAALAIPRVQMRDPTTLYNPMVVQDAITKYPYVFGAFLHGSKVLETTSLKKSETMVFMTPLRFYDGIEQFIQHTELEALKTLLEFQYVSNVAQYMGEPFLAAHFDLFGKALSGQKTRPAREKVCAQVVQNAFPALVGKYYSEARFDPTSEKKAQDMIERIERAMTKRMEDSSWLDDETRHHALDKLSKVTNLIGHAKDVEDFDATLLKAEAFLANMEATLYFKYQTNLDRINKPVDRTKWSMSAAEVNAYYLPSQNKLVFPAGILQPPFFHSSNLPAQNFGGIGMVMGHELTHGFDSSGRRFDGDGNLMPWWTNATSTEFEKRSQCLIDQYSKFELRSDVNASVVIGKVNGKLTLGENIADHGGFGLAFDAFHEYQLFRQQQRQQQQQNLRPKPTNFTKKLGDMDRLFFVAFAQSWCDVNSDSYARALLNGVHSPGQFRVIGTVQNNPHFGKLFNCDVGTFMNPKDKCQVW